MANYQTQYTSLTEKLIQSIRKQAKQNNYTVLHQINDSVNWKEIADPIREELSGAITGRYRQNDLTLIVKSFVLQSIYVLSNNELAEEIGDRKSFQSFLGVKSVSEIPSGDALSYFRELFMSKGLYNNLLNIFCEQMLEAKFQLSPRKEENIFDKLTESDDLEENDLQVNDEPREEFTEINNIVENKINEIENRLKTLFDKRAVSDDDLRKEEIIPDTVSAKLKKVGEQVKKLNKTEEKVEDKGSNQIYEKLLQIDAKLKELDKAQDDRIAEVKRKGEARESIKNKGEEKRDRLLEKLMLLDEKLTTLSSEKEIIPEVKHTETVIKNQTKELEEKFSKEIDKKTGELFEKLLSIDLRLKNMFDHTPALKEEKVEEKKEEIIHETESVNKQEPTDTENLYKKLFDTFYNQLIDANLVGNEQETITEPEKPQIVIDKIVPEAEEKPLTVTVNVVPEAGEKSAAVQDIVKKATEEISDKNKELEDKIKRIENDYKNLLDKLTAPRVETKAIPEVKIIPPPVSSDDRLKKLDEEIQEIYRGSSATDFVIPEVKPVSEPAFVPKPVVKVERQKAEEISAKSADLIEQRRRNEVNLKKKRKVIIFNDANLTEDYEFGLRFYKLGFKVAFVNMKIEQGDEYSIVATGEYFPNTFWGSVKQRSRWIAGITLQNWKIHQWKGDFKTKYFLMRDRKSLFNFVGLFLANAVFAYFIYNLLSMVFEWKPVLPLVQKSSLLWYLMVISFFFMVIRLVHRFVFTYNWYGFKYAVASMGRMLFDNIVNFFAMIRAFKVYRANKTKAVWDSTDHY